MFFLLASFLAQSAQAAEPGARCPVEPSVRDPDGQVTVLAQNLKFIITGGKRAERDRLLADWLGDEGAGVDLLLLSEARLTSSFLAWQPEWCFYTQASSVERDGYRWAPIVEGRPPAGLAIGIRQRAEGVERTVSSDAGRPFRARATSMAEGVLGVLTGFRKGWAGLQIDDTHLVWSHTQASYRGHPERGAGAGRAGRAGQFDDLADDLGRPERPTLLTGDLNLLAGFRARRPDDDARLAEARDIDGETVARFEARTGIDLSWRWPWKREPRPPDAGPIGTFKGGFDRSRPSDVWDADAPYDRVGVNRAFLDLHPGTRVRPVEIARGTTRVSDHLGLEIAIPFGNRPTAKRPHPRDASCPVASVGPVGRLGAMRAGPPVTRRSAREEWAEAE